MRFLYNFLLETKKHESERAQVYETTNVIHGQVVHV